MTKRKSTIFIPLFLLYILFFNSSCSEVRKVSSLEKTKTNSCYNKEDYHYTISEMPKPLFIENIDSSLIHNFSFDALNIANAFGFLDLIEKYNYLKINTELNSTLENEFDLIKLKLNIIQKINASSLEVSSVASELDCEEERADQIANFLKSKKAERENKLVIGSIIVGALGTIAAESLNNNPSNGNSGSYVAVGVALTEAVIGVILLTNKKKIQFIHERNTLGEIWNKPSTSKTLPPSIWYYLNYKDENIRKISLQELLIDHWATFGQISKRVIDKNEKSNEIYFGIGGKYTSEQLSNRADMYDQLESYINLMKQDLRILSEEFEKYSK